ncbi:MAG: hypothetical protein Q8896_07525, partial [Bacteroidota bacterium]|nr:hypothetical protein [Bacteroidota bacterium]
YQLTGNGIGVQKPGYPHGFSPIDHLALSTWKLKLSRKQGIEDISSSNLMFAFSKLPTQSRSQ